MLSFTYTARNTKTGQKITADIEANNEKEAAKILVDRGLAPLEIKAKTKKSFISFGHKVKPKSRVLFSRQLSTLINAGLPLMQSLTTVQGQTADKNLKPIIGEVIKAVEAGAPLAEALTKYPDTFDDVYISLVAAGEASGTLDTSLDRLATQQEKDSDVVSKVRGAMIYPLIVLLVLFGVLIFMMVAVLPQVENLYKSLPGTKLPFITVWLISISGFITHFWWIVGLLLVFVGLIGRQALRTEKGKLYVDQLKISMWPIAPLFMKLYMSRFARTASTLVASGVPMIKMLTTASQAVGNAQIAKSINKAVEKVKGGTALSDSIKGDPHFLELVPNMIHIGEQSGALGDMLGKVADYYEKEVDNEIKSISTIIEPAMMIIVGVLALIMVAAVLLPIYSLAGKNLGAQ